MNTKIDHAAMNVNEFEWHVRFFQDVFGMTIEKSQGEKPDRKVWFAQGIQLNEIEETATEDTVTENEPGGSVSAGKSASCWADHIGIRTDDMEGVLNRSREFGCTPVSGKGKNWFQMPGGAIFELK